MQIKFIEEYTIQAAGGKTYPVGYVLDCNRGTADHFVNNGVAVAVEKKTKPEPPPVADAQFEKAESQSYVSQPAPASRRKTLSMSKGRLA